VLTSLAFLVVFLFFNQNVLPCEYIQYLPPFCVSAVWQRQNVPGPPFAMYLCAGSDDFTLFLWDPSNQKQPRARMTGHMQLVNQARLVPIRRLF
jgi:ribosome assembly protein 4